MQLQKLKHIFNPSTIRLAHAPDVLHVLSIESQQKIYISIPISPLLKGIFFAFTEKLLANECAQKFPPSGKFLKSENKKVRVFETSDDEKILAETFCRANPF